MQFAQDIRLARAQVVLDALKGGGDVQLIRDGAVFETVPLPQASKMCFAIEPPDGGVVMELPISPRVCELGRRATEMRIRDADGNVIITATGEDILGRGMMTSDDYHHEDNSAGDDNTIETDAVSRAVRVNRRRASGFDTDFAMRGIAIERKGGKIARITQGSFAVDVLREDNGSFRGFREV